ncbi:MAG: hypothetical protein RL681_596 [Candidatus Parcubacteria bacterium]
MGPHSVLAQNPASLYVGPASGTFTVGSTFTVSLYVNTSGNNVNALDAQLEYPADKLQVVSPTAGKSIINIWVSQPSYDNHAGKIRFQGAIPTPGINTSAGLISQVAFRVTSIGTAILRFTDGSRVLLNDGHGTDILGQTTSGVYHLALPPPAGPIVTSPTHPDQERWYNTNTVTFEWGGENADGFSYLLSNDPIDYPDDVAEGTKTSQTYKSLEDGAHYFHVKALKSGSWGGVTHYVARVDTQPPADFPVEIAPSMRTTSMRPSIAFETTDSLSGVDHYEIRLVSLSPQKANAAENGEQSFFIEAASPYVPSLDYGDYDVIVRAYDKAGNYTQETQRLEIVTYAFDIVSGTGIKIKSNLIVPWLWIFVILGVLIVSVGFAARRLWHAHRQLHEIISAGGSITPEVQKQLDELKALKAKYNQSNKSLLALLALGITLGMLFGGSPAFAAIEGAPAELSPPIVELVPTEITNKDILYIGGTSDVPGSVVHIYLQSLTSGETLRHDATAEKNGKWFFTFPTFLSSGKYLLWTQGQIGNLQSPPSPQFALTVSPTAIQFGASRMSYELIYLVAAIVLALALFVQVWLALYYRKAIRVKREKLLAETRRAEESIRRGFALLRRDLEAEFAAIERLKSSGELPAEEKEREQKILQDMETVKRYIGEEVWELEKDI